MRQSNVRVMLASEHPEVRFTLREIVEAEGEAVIVAQAENAVRALALARNLRPDVAIIDSYLPHTVGLDTIRLSRIGGLDAARIISEEMPKMLVVLLNGGEGKVLTQRSWGSEVAFFCREAKGEGIPFRLGELNGETPGRLIFARVESKPRPVLAQKAASLSNSAIFFGAFGLLSGWFLIITMFLAGVGAYVALAGAAAMLAGLAGKLISKTKIWK